MKLTDSKKALLVGTVIFVGIVTILSLYGYFITQTKKPNFDMNGTIEDITIPCPFNVQCNPVYWLDAEDGNTYHLLFSYGTRLPNGEQQICEGLPALQEPCLSKLPKRGQHIEVIGIVTYNTEGICDFVNGKPVPCQPIGTVNVSSWQPTPTPTSGTSSPSPQEKLPNKTLRPISVVSVQPGCARVKLNGGVGCNPGGPAFTVTLNASSTNVPVTHLSAMLMLTEMQNNFSINFTFPDINQSNPLMPGQNTSETSGAVIGPVDVLNVNGTTAVLIESTLQNGQSFSYWTNDTTS